MKFKTVAIATFLLSGCQSLNRYDGPELSHSETAEIYVATGNDMGLSVNSINDDNEGYFYKKRVYVLPGEYTVELRSTIYNSLSSYRTQYVGSFTLRFSAKAGYTYLFKTTAYAATRMDRNTEACVYEELQNDPKANKNWTGEFREPSINAIKLNCSKVVIRQISP